MTGDDRRVIIEYFDDKFAAFLENVETIVDKKLQPVVEDLMELKSDMKAVKAAITETNRDVHDLNRRVTVLETA